MSSPGAKYIQSCFSSRNCLDLLRSLKTCLARFLFKKCLKTWDVPTTVAEDWKHNHEGRMLFFQLSFTWVCYLFKLSLLHFILFIRLVTFVILSICNVYPIVLHYNVFCVQVLSALESSSSTVLIEKNWSCKIETVLFLVPNMT